MNDRLMKPPEVADMLRVSTVTLGRWRRIGKGPEHIRLGYNRVVYRYDDVVAWISAKAGDAQ